MTDEQDTPPYAGRAVDPPEDDLEAKFWEAVAKTEGTRMATVRFSDSTWHQLVMAGSTVYLDGTVLPSGEFAQWDRDLTPDEVRDLFEAFSAGD